MTKRLWIEPDASEVIFPASKLDGIYSVIFTVTTHTGQHQSEPSRMDRRLHPLFAKWI